MSDEISITIYVITRTIKQELKAGYTPDTAFQSILEEAYDYVKMSQKEKDGVEIFLGMFAFN